MAAMIEEAGVSKDAKEKKGKKIVKRKTVDKWKKKKWFTLIAPDFFDKQILGETPAEEEKMVQNRVIRLSAAEVTKQPKFGHVSLSFKVNGVSGQKAQTIFVGHEMQEGYIRRLVRRRSSKITVVQTVTVKTGEKLRVKAVAFTNRKATGPQETEIRRRMEKEMADAAQKKEFGQFVQELIFGNASSGLFKVIKPIIPIKRVEIQKSQLIEEKSKTG